MKFFRLLRALAVTAPVAFSVTGLGAELISNGGFETGFIGWTRSDQIGSEGTFFLQTGTLSPVNANGVPAPPQGITAAMSDAEGPGSHVLYQDIVIPPAVFSASLSFSLFLHNFASDYSTPETLDFSTPALNQQARVDILTSTSDPFSVAVGDVVLNVYQTQIGDASVSGYTIINQDLTSLFQAHLGETLRLRFAEVDNVSLFNAGVDNVSIVSEVPEVSALVPGSLTLLGILGLTLGRRLVNR